jgi:hypothetical protein
MQPLIIVKLKLDNVHVANIWPGHHKLLYRVILTV